MKNNKNISTKKSLNPGGFTSKFYQIYKEYLRLILCKKIQEIEEKVCFSAYSAWSA